MLSTAFCASLFLQRIQAHSWVRCTDYQTTINGLDYDEGECEGWIRNWEFDNVAFGTDRGINYQVGVGGGQSLCQATLSGSKDNDYSLREDKATTYVPGSTVRVVWPAKNHANYGCSSNIPDTSMKLFMNPNVDPSSDLPNTASTMTGNGYVLVKDWQEGCQAGTDGCGFQNCRRFCENTDKATCFGDFVVPDVEQSGWYTFVWYWIFNPGTPYISCYEAYIDKTGTITTPDDTTDDDTTDDVIDEPVIASLVTEVPVCITTDGSYDASDVFSFAVTQFTSVARSDDDIYVVDQCDAADGYQFTVQLIHAATNGAAVVTIADTQFCDAFEQSNTFSGSSCEISDECGEIKTFATYERTPSPVTASASGGISITNVMGSGQWYLPINVNGVESCAVSSVQIQDSNGVFQDNARSYNDGSTVYQFDGMNFGSLLPITMRVVLTSGQTITMENIIEDTNGGSSFDSGKTCTDTDDSTPIQIDDSNVCTPSPTRVAGQPSDPGTPEPIPTSAPTPPPSSLPSAPSAPSAPSSVMTPTSAPSTAEGPVDQSAAARFAVHGAAIALSLFFFF